MNKGFSFGTSSLFGSPAQPEKVDPLMQRLYDVRDSYNRENQKYKFQAIVYSVKKNGTVQAPKCASEEEWDTAMAMTPTGLVSGDDAVAPSMLCGVDDLEKWVWDGPMSQGKVIDLMEKKLEDMKKQIAELHDEMLNFQRKDLLVIEEKDEEAGIRLIAEKKKDELRDESGSLIDMQWITKLGKELRPKLYFLDKIMQGNSGGQQPRGSYVEDSGNRGFLEDFHKETLEILRATNEELLGLQEILKDMDKKTEESEKRMLAFEYGYVKPLDEKNEPI